MQFEQVWGYRQAVRLALMDRGKGPEDLRVLSRRLGWHLNRRIGNLRFHWNPTPVLDHQHLIITGDFDYDGENPRPINIWLNSHPDCRFYCFNKPGHLTWQQFIYNLSECVMHEKVHELQHQYHCGDVRALPDTGDAEQDYYLDPDEIDAYAWSLASESCDRGGVGGLLDPADDSSWWNYANIFDQDHLARRRLLKKAYQRICLAKTLDQLT